MRSLTGRSLGRPKPPASSTGVDVFGSSSSASGLPRDSERMRVSTRSSHGPGSTERSRARASRSGRPSISSSGRVEGSAPPGASSSGTRAANTIATDSASRRRAVNSRLCREALSSHCASSTTHSRGRLRAVSESRPRTPRATRKASGARFEPIPRAPLTASRCPGGSLSSRSVMGAHS